MQRQIDLFASRQCRFQLLAMDAQSRSATCKLQLGFGQPVITSDLVDDPHQDVPESARFGSSSINAGQEQMSPVAYSRARRLRSQFLLPVSWSELSIVVGSEKVKNTSAIFWYSVYIIKCNLKRDEIMVIYLLCDIKDRW